jgi:predicted metalloprotease with PDZ domain
MRFTLTTIIFLSLTCSAQKNNGYQYYVNLNEAKNDKVAVSLTPPQFTTQVVDFLFPAMVPGTYEVYDFGRFISDLKVTGKNGKAIKIEKKDVNTYRLSPATDIAQITYKVDDTFDKTDLPLTSKKVVFEPGGTNFEEGKNFSLNNHSMFGYFRNMTHMPFTVTFEKPPGFYPATGLSDMTLGETRDTLRANDYHLLVDSPVMYSQPDTSTIMVAQTKVLIATYSPNKTITASFIANTLKELLAAQKAYLGGELPVNKYAFLFYFFDIRKSTQSGASGALEHSYSSFYVLPELDSVSLKQQIRDVAAHEFFHIVTPLNIHSKEIGNFDFNDPKMSAHLWLYEGMTEYAAHHAQVKARLIDVNEFINVMMQKYHNSQELFNDTMSFTYMSKHVLDEKIHKQYGNVYEKGAVIGMCLDILLRDLSDGKYGTQELMKDLSRRYGKDSSFNDDELFGEIEKLTYPQVGEFLRKYVGGNSPLPMEDILARIGIVFTREAVSKEFTLGNPELSYNPATNRLLVTGVKELDAFGKDLGYKRGDELSTLNGTELKVENIRDIVSGYYENLKEGDVVKMDVYRPRKLRKKKYKKVLLEARAVKVESTRKNQISVAEEVSDKQKMTLKSWVGI